MNTIFKDEALNIVNKYRDDYTLMNRTFFIKDEPYVFAIPKSLYDGMEASGILDEYNKRVVENPIDNSYPLERRLKFEAFAVPFDYFISHAMKKKRSFKTFMDAIAEKEGFELPEMTPNEFGETVQMLPGDYFVCDGIELGGKRVFPLSDVFIVSHKEIISMYAAFFGRYTEAGRLLLNLEDKYYTQTIGIATRVKI